MLSLMRQISPPTGIELACYCNFFSTHEKHLVTASVNQLNVYRLYEEEETQVMSSTVSQVPTKKFECLASYSLFGNIADMKSVSFQGLPRDILLLSFKTAKLSTVQYNPATHELSTLSLHYFEEHCGKACINSLFVPKIRVDVDNRCAVLLIGSCKLVVLPFNQSVTLDESTDVSPSPITSSYVIELNKMAEKIDNVVDLQFLYGYHDPTIFILYEPQPTCYGRVAIRKDTCKIVAVSVNITDKVHPVIWFLDGLPFDCFKVLSIPKPIGGVLLFAVNSLIYLNQSIPPYAVSLNSIAESSSSFPFRAQKDVKIALDCAQVCLISADKIVLSLKGGELYVVTLVVDAMRSVRSFHFNKVASSVYTTCVVQCGFCYLFLGSRLGNSLLIKYNTSDTKADPVPNAAPNILEDTTSNVSENVAMDTDSLEVYGITDTQTGSSIVFHRFFVCDSLLNIGPCTSCTIGEPAFLSDEFISENRYDLEITTTSGYGKSGSLTVLQQTVRPHVVTTFDLSTCVDMWTVFSQSTEQQDSKDESSENARHSHLILSRSDTTMVLQTGQEITELEHSGFNTHSRTVYAGNIGACNHYIIQVSEMGVRLLDGVTQLQHIPIDIGSKICLCSVVNPYVLLLSQDGVLMMLVLKEEYQPKLVVNPTPDSSSVRIVDISLYCDESGIFSLEDDHYDDKCERVANTSETSFSVEIAPTDDEDELLYADIQQASFSNQSDMDVSSTTQTNRQPQTKTCTYWCFLIRESGCLEIYSIPEFTLVYYVRNLTLGLTVLVDSGDSHVSTEKPHFLPEHVCRQFTVIGLGYKKTRPHLMLLFGDNLYIYEAYQYFNKATTGRLGVRFKRVVHDLLLRDRKRAKSQKLRVVDNDNTNLEKRPRRLRVFTDIGGYSGVFLSGSQPYWIVMTSHGILRFHRMVIDGAVDSIAEFNNVNCANGFIYFNGKGEVRISTLPSHLSFDSPWITKKVVLRKTPHFVCYHKESRLYAIVTSTSEPCNQYPHASGDDKEIEIISRDERFVAPSLDKFMFELLSPTDWTVEAGSEIKYDDWECVTCMKHVMLRYEGAVSGLKGYVAVGTTTIHTEEVYSRGKVYLYDIVEVVPEPGQPTRHKVKVFVESEQRSPITAICAINGLLATAVGQKIYIWQVLDNDLSGLSFIDTFIYIHSLESIKNLFVAADVTKSIIVYRYQESLKAISLVSRDTNSIEVYGINYLVDHKHLVFVVTDSHKNLLMYSFNPENRESQGGKRLIRIADINVGSHINSLFRVQCRYDDPAFDKKTSATFEKRQVTYYTTLDGSFGYILPLSEKVYRRLLNVQNVLTLRMTHFAGLNPKAYRTMVSGPGDLSNAQRNILDGSLLWKYLSLSVTEQSEIAKRVGITADSIIDDFIDIDRATLHF